MKYNNKNRVVKPASDLSTDPADFGDSIGTADPVATLKFLEKRGLLKVSDEWWASYAKNAKRG